MSDGIFVTHTECEDYRKEFSEAISNQGVRLAVLESNIGDIKNLLKAVVGSILSVGGTIVVILLTRGI